MRQTIYYILFILLLFSCTREQDKITLYLIGDSTMAPKKEEARPETGWGEMLPQFFNKNLIVKNHAVNGRSSKSFIDEGRWQTVLDSLQPGDYVCIQFGHNDEKAYDPRRFTNPVTTYRGNLIRFIEETRTKGAHPILATPLVRRKFNEDSVLTDTHGLYPLIVHEVSDEYQVPLIDLQFLTEERVTALGVEKSKSLYNWLEPGQYTNYPDGRQDNTHLNPEGAGEVAGMFVAEITRQDIPLKDWLK